VRYTFQNTDDATAAVPADFSRKHIMPENNQDESTANPNATQADETPPEGADPLFAAILAKQAELMAEGHDASLAGVAAAFDVLSGGREKLPL
jgi:hypothetical protein